MGQADGCSAGSPAASCFLRKRGCTCPCPSSCGTGSARRGMWLWVPSSPPPARPADRPNSKVVGEEEQQGDRECWRVELGGLILHIVNHYLPHNLFLFSRGFTGTRSQKRYEEYVTDCFLSKMACLAAGSPASNTRHHFFCNMFMPNHSVNIPYIVWFVLALTPCCTANLLVPHRFLSSW